MERPCRSLFVGLVISSLVTAFAFPLAAEDRAAEAAFRFTLAKLLAQEGDYRKAEAAFSEAVDLAPEDVYLRREHAEFLSRLARLTRAPEVRLERLKAAAAEIEAAKTLAPANVDVLRTAGDIYLALIEIAPLYLGEAQRTLEALRERAPDELEAMVSLGQIYLYQQEAGKAVAVFRDVANRVPDNRMVYSALGEALLRAGQDQEAEEVLGKILELDPAALDTRLTLARLASDRGDHEAAIRVLLATPPDQATHGEVLQQLVMEYYHSGQLEVALAKVGELLELYPDHPRGRALRSHLLVVAGRNTEAIAELSDLLAQTPADTRIASALANVLEREGRRDEAIAVLEGVLTRLAGPDDQEAADEMRLGLAELHGAAERWQTAAELLRPVVERAASESRLPALLLYVQALFEQGQGEEALRLLAAEKDATEVVAASRAEILLKLERADEARAILDSLVASGGASAVLAAARVHQRLERYSDAAAILARYLEEEPEQLDVIFLLGAAYERLGRSDEAVAAFRKLLALDPQYHPALNYLGYMWAEKGQNLAEALDLIRRAVVLDPGNGAYIDSLGWVHFQLGDYGEARNYLEQAARLIPDDATIYEHLGDVYLVMGEREKARQVYLRALELGEDNAEEVRRKLGEI